MNIQSQSWLIDRRHALKALGSFISLPLLDCMVPLRAAEKIATDKKNTLAYPSKDNITRKTVFIRVVKL